MLEITIPENEFWDEKHEIFVKTKATKLKLEHSLIALSKWEFNWEKPFLDPKFEPTGEEFLDYIRCMTITSNVPDMVYYSLTEENINEILAYINKKATATWFNRTPGSRPRSSTVWTSELIYFQMIQCGIPFECEKWHLNRLMTLIRVYQAETSKKKMPKSAVARQYAALNKARRAKYNTKG